MAVAVSMVVVDIMGAELFMLQGPMLGLDLVSVMVLGLLATLTGYMAPGVILILLITMVMGLLLRVWRCRSATLRMTIMHRSRMYVMIRRCHVKKERKRSIS